MKYAHSDILDGGLTALKTTATRMLLVKTYASGDSYATVTGNQLGSVTMASGNTINFPQLEYASGQPV